MPILSSLSPPPRHVLFVFFSSALARFGCVLSQLCMTVCRDQGKMYSGTQYSAECFCGDEDTDHLTHGECDGEMCKCDYPCAGDENEICGGYWSMNVRELV